jgi:hypothetical protein
MNDGSNYLGYSFYEDNSYKPKTGDLYKEQIKSQFVKFMSCLCVTDYIIKVGGFDQYLAFEDVDFFLRFSKKYKFYYMNKVTGYWRKHENNMTKSLYTNVKLIESRLLAYNKHIGDDIQVDKMLKPKIIKLIKLLHKHKKYINFQNNFKTCTKMNKLLFYFYKKKISYRAYYFLETTADYFFELKKCVGKVSNLPPNKF